jgi:hypothetical protein
MRHATYLLAAVIHTHHGSWDTYGRTDGYTHFLDPVTQVLHDPVAGVLRTPAMSFRFFPHSPSKIHLLWTRHSELWKLDLFSLNADSPRHGTLQFVSFMEPRLDRSARVHTTSLNPAIPLSSSPFAERSHMACGNKLVSPSSNHRTHGIRRSAYRANIRSYNLLNCQSNSSPSSPCYEPPGLECGIRSSDLV